MNEQYLYPQNLKSQAKLWLWNLRDLVIIGAALLLSVLAIAQLKAILPLAIKETIEKRRERKEDLEMLA